MTQYTIEKAPGACDTEGFDICPYKFNSATDTQNSKAIEILMDALALACNAAHQLLCDDFLACKRGDSSYVQDFDARHACTRTLEVCK